MTSPELKAAARNWCDEAMKISGYIPSAWAAFAAGAAWRNEHPEYTRELEKGFRKQEAEIAALREALERIRDNVNDPPVASELLAEMALASPNPAADLTARVRREALGTREASKSFGEYWSHGRHNCKTWAAKSEEDRHMLTWFTALAARERADG